MPQKNISYAVADMMSHIMERYFTNTTHSEVIDGMCEGLLRVIIKEARYLLHHPGDYDALAELSLAGSKAHDDFLSSGMVTDWANHPREEVISGMYNDVAHGAGLLVQDVINIYQLAMED